MTYRSYRTPIPIICCLLYELSLNCGFPFFQLRAIEEQLILQCVQHLPNIPTPNRT